MTVRRTIQSGQLPDAQKEPPACKRPRWSPTLEELLFQLSFGDLNLNRLIDLLIVTTLVVRIILDGGGEESVDEGRLSETRLARNLSQSARPSKLNREANVPLP